MASLKYLRSNVLWLYGQGLYKIDQNSSRTIKILYSLWRLTCVFWLGSVVVLALVDILMKDDDYDFNSIAVNIMFIVIYTGGVVRLNYYYIFEDECAKMVEQMNAKFRYQTKTGLVEKNMANHVAFSERAANTWNLLGFFCGEAFVTIMPYLAGSTRRRLPLPLWYPFNWQASPYFEMIYVTQIISQGLCALTFTSIDVFFICLAYLTTGQLELLSWEFDNMIYSALLKRGMAKEKVLALKRAFAPTNDEISGHHRFLGDNPRWLKDIYEIILSDSVQQQLVENFKELIGFHQDFLTFWKGVNRFFNPLMLVNTIETVLQMILYAYILNMATDEYLLAEIASYLTFVVVQLFATSYFGQMLTTKNNDLRLALYNSPWYLCGREFQNSLKMVLRQIGWPIAVNLGKFAAMDLNIFVWALKTSFSYFTVLRQMTQQE